MVRYQKAGMSAMKNNLKRVPSQDTFYKSKSNHGGESGPAIVRAVAVEGEHAEIKRIIADATRAHVVLRIFLLKVLEAPNGQREAAPIESRDPSAQQHWASCTSTALPKSANDNGMKQHYTDPSEPHRSAVIEAFEVVLGRDV